MYFSTSVEKNFIPKKNNVQNPDGLKIDFFCVQNPDLSEFLDIYCNLKICTVDVQKPNFRFGEPNQIWFGYRTFGLTQFLFGSLV